MLDLPALKNSNYKVMPKTLEKIAVESQLVLSIFHGADILGLGFDQTGFCVVRAGEIDLGFDVRDFIPVRDRFNGIIAGSPCQSFSLANRLKRNPNGYGLEMIHEFGRIVKQANPDWFLLENVPSVPDIRIDKYFVQRIDIRASECGLPQSRLRHFQFGSRAEHRRVITIKRERRIKRVSRCCVASEGKRRNNRRDFEEFCRLQGLPKNFYLPMFSLIKNYELIGNAVPLPMAKKIAEAIRENLENGNDREFTLCACGCGRRITGKQKSATQACRKRLQYKRSNSRSLIYL